MQTFLPFDEFKRSAAVLDSKRLGKQRVECLQILSALTKMRLTKYVPGVDKEPDDAVVLSDGIITLKPIVGPIPWGNHPAVRMWTGCERSLYTYALTITLEWKRRGYKDTCQEKLGLFENILLGPATRLPGWISTKAFHDSHKSNLLRKDYTYYSKFSWDVPTDLPYVWPVRDC